MEVNGHLFRIADTCAHLEAGKEKVGKWGRVEDLRKERESQVALYY